MLAAHPSKSGDNPLPKEAGGQPIEESVRKFLTQVVDALEHSPRSSAATGREEIILDMIVDGTRYLLIRMSVPTPAFVSLTPREQEIVRMVAKGYPNKTIAGVLNISCWTVGTHLRRTFAKLGVASRAAMIARIMEEYPGWDRQVATDMQRRNAVAPSSRPTSAHPARSETARAGQSVHGAPASIALPRGVVCPQPGR